MKTARFKPGTLAAAVLVALSSQAVKADDAQVQPSPPATQAENAGPTAQSLPEIIVTDSPQNAYATSVASTGTKTDTPLIETPASVQVIPQQVLQDQKATTFDQALTNVSGVRSSTTGWQENIYIRGFSTSTYFRDGFRIDDPSGLGGTATLSNVDSIEVLKGPGAVLYGRVEPGGVVNITTKQPQSAPHYSFEQSIGSWDHYISNFDATGPLNEDKTLLYRINLSRDASDFWIDNVKDTREFIAPTLQWKPDSRTQVTLEGSYSHDKATLYQQSVVPFDSSNYQFLWGNKSANPAPYKFSPDTRFIGLNWSHRFDNDWTLKQQISHNQVDFSTPLNPSTASGPLSLIGNTWMLGLGTAQLTGNTQSEGTVIDLTGHFDSGVLKHTLLVGADYYRVRAYYNSRYSNPSGPFAIVPLFSSMVPDLSSIPLDQDTYYSTDSTTISYGIYIQDQIKLADKFNLLAGLRYQNVRTSGITNAGINMGGTGSPTGDTPTHDSATTPRIGLLWRAQDWLSLYTSYTENFGATNATLTDWQGNPLKPEGAKQYELGGKSDFLDGKLTASMALFDLTKTNVSANSSHPNGIGGFFPEAIGKIESKGIEFNVQGEIQPGLDGLLAYTYDRTSVIDGTSSYTAGSRLPFVPKQMLRLFTTYKFKQESLRGWKIGGGMTWQGSSPGLYMDPITYVYDTNKIKSPSYQVYDAMASYDFKAGKNKAIFQLNIKNLFNKSYFTDAFMYVGPWGYVTYGAPRSVMASLKVDF